MKKNITTIVAAVASAALLWACCDTPKTQNIPTNKKEVMDGFLAGTLDESYVPAAFFIHFPPDSKVGERAVNTHLRYLLETNMDIMKIQFEQFMPRIADLDKQESWDAITPVADDFYQSTFEVIKGIYDVVGQDVYVIPTIYSAFQVATQSLGVEAIRKAAVKRPDDLKRVLGYYADALVKLAKQCKAIGIEGFYTTTQGGEMKFYDIPDFFDNFIKPYDMQVMTECNTATKLNILHICDWEGTYDDLTRYKDYPGQIVNTPINLNGTEFTLQDGYELFKRPVLGGLQRTGEILSADAATIGRLSHRAIADGPKGVMMLGAECTVSQAPIENIHAAVEAAHHSQAETE